MADENNLLKLGIEADEASIQKTKDAIGSIAKETTRLADGISKAARSAALDELPKKFGRIAAETGDVEKAVFEMNEEIKRLGASDKEIDKIATSFIQVEKAAKEAAEAAKEAAKEAAEAAKEAAEFEPNITPAKRRFDKVSEEVSLAGDAESSLRTIGGAAGFFGGSGIEQITNAGGEILATVEALPKLKEAIGGLPDAIGSAASSLGPAGLITAAALAAVAVAVADFAAQAQEQADQLNAIIDAQRSVNEQIASGLTTEDAEAQIAQLERRRELENEVLADSQAAYEQFIEGIRNSFGIFAPLVEGFVKAVDGREEALNEQIAKSKEITEGYTSEINALNQAMSEGKLAANDRAADESKPKSSGGGDSDKAAQDAARAQEKAAQDAARAQEKAANDAIRAQEKAAAEQERLAQQVAQAQDNMAKAGQKYGQSLQDIDRNLSNSLKDIARKSQDSSADSRKNFNRDIASLNLKAQDDEKAARRKSYQDLEKIDSDHKKALADIAKDAADSEENARSNRNFLQLEESRKAQRKAIDDAKSGTGDAIKERLKQDKIEADERLQGLAIARRDRKTALDRELADNKTAADRAARDAKLNAQRQEENAKIAYQRELQAQREHLSKLLAQRQDFYAAEAAAAGQAANPATAAKGGGSSSGGGGGYAPFNSGLSSPMSAGIPTSALKGGGATNVNNRSINMTVNTGANANDTIRLIRKVLS